MDGWTGRHAHRDARKHMHTHLWERDWVKIEPEDFEAFDTAHLQRQRVQVRVLADVQLRQLAARTHTRLAP